MLTRWVTICRPAGQVSYFSAIGESGLAEFYVLGTDASAPLQLDIETLEMVWATLGCGPVHVHAAIRGVVWTPNASKSVAEA